MAKNIVLYIADTEFEQIPWLICDDRGNPVSETKIDSLERIAAQVEGRKVIVIVPAEWVTLTSASVPGSSARAARAIPYALEEMLSEDVEELHFAVGDRQGSDTYPVAVIASELMFLLQERFTAAGLRPTEVRPEPLALPRFKEEHNSWTAYVKDHRLVVRLDDFAGYAIEWENAGLLLKQSMQEAGDARPAGIVLFKNAGQTIDPLDSSLELEEREYKDQLSLFASGVFNSSAINLLQGEFSFKQQFDRAWKPWRPAIALLLVLGVIFGAGRYIEYRKLSTQIETQKAEMADILQRTFPSVKRVVNARKQMQSEMKKLGAAGINSGFVSVINSISSSLGEAGNTTLNSINYKSGRIDLDLDTDRLSTLDKLKQTLEGDGKYRMTIESANQSNGRIRGRIRVEVRG